VGKKSAASKGSSTERLARQKEEEEKVVLVVVSAVSELHSSLPLQREGREAGDEDGLLPRGRDVRAGGRGRPP